jgi:hypothetical protein
VITASFILLFASAVFLFSPITWYFEDPLPNFILSKMQQFVREPQRHIALCFRRMTEPATYSYDDQPDNQVLLGKFIKRNYKRGSTIVYDQMGRVPYFAGTNIIFIDSSGLTDKVIGRAKFYYKCQGSSLLRSYEIISRYIINAVYPGNNNFFYTKEALMNYVFEKNPEVIMCLAPIRTFIINFMATDSRFQRNYQVKYFIAGALIFERKGLIAKSLDIPEGLPVVYEQDIFKDPYLSSHPLVSAVKNYGGY